MKNKEYFFILDPYVYFLNKPKEVFFYNTLTNKSMESSEESIVKFLSDIQEGKNLSVKKISGAKLINDIKLKNFLFKLKEGFFGDLIELEEGDTPPIQLYPILGLKKTDSGKFDFSDENNTLDYLKNVNIYLNNSCDLKCKYCNSANKQFLCCGIKDKKNSEIDYDQVADLIKYLKQYPNVNLSFSGGNIFRYTKLNHLVKFLNSSDNKKSFYVHYINLFNNLDNLEMFKNSNILINILVDFEENNEDIKNKLSEIKKSGIDFKYIFIIQNDSDLDKLDQVIEENEIADYSIRPLFNGKNKTFFRNNVFNTKTEILDQKLSIKDIFKNQVFNTSFLGSVNILNNGDYYINLNKKKVGNLNNDTINDIVNSELTRNGDWFLTRDEVGPCKDCNYKFLCPAISNYEFNLQEFNLCKVI